MHVGTNNVEYTPEQVCEGILEIIRTIREKHPSAYIVLPVSITFLFKFYKLMQISDRVFRSQISIEL